MERQGKEDYERLEQRVRYLEQEVEFLKQQLDGKDGYPTASQTRKESNFSDQSRANEATNKTTYEAIHQPTYEETIKGTTKEQSYAIHKPKSGAPVKEKESVDWENLIGRVWLPRIFIFVLLMGLIWGFKVAVDYGVLTEPVRVALGFGAAIVLYFLGEKQIKNTRESLGKSLLIGAIGLLILTTFSMNVLYGMIPTMVAFALNVLWVGIGIYLAHRYHSQVMAILIAIAGYLVPFLVADTDHVLVAVVYEIVYYALLVYYAIYKGFKRLFYVATSLLHVVYLIFILGLVWNYDSDLFSVMAIGAVLQHVIIFYSVYQAKFAKLFPVPLLFTSFIVTTFWVRIGTSEYEYLYVVYLIAVSLGYAFVVYWEQNKKRGDLLSVALSIATFGVFLLLLYTFKDKQQVLIASLLIEGVIALYLGCRFQVLFQKISGAFVFLVGTVLTMFTEIYDIVSLETCVWVLFILACYALIYIIKRFYGSNKTVQVITLGVILGHIQFLAGLPQYDGVFTLELLARLATVLSLVLVYVWTKQSYATNKMIKALIIGVNAVIQLVFLTDLVRFMTNDFSHNITMMSISFAWALYATASVLIGVFFNKKGIRLLGIGLLILTLAKLILVDLQYVTIVVRAILFIGLGGIGMVLSRLLYVKK